MASVRLDTKLCSRCFGVVSCLLLRPDSLIDFGAIQVLYLLTYLLTYLLLFYCATLCLSAVFARCRSVRPSVHLSVTLVDCIQMAEDVKLFSDW